jgi:hypothetical protein
MKNKNSSLIPELSEIFIDGDAKSLRDFCEAGRPAFVRKLISALSGNESWTVIRQEKNTRLIPGTFQKDKTYSYNPDRDECRNPSVWRVTP